MAKSVLGNDPFQRGAAPNATTPAPAPAASPPAPAAAAPPPSTKRPVTVKPGQGKKAKAAAKRAGEAAPKQRPAPKPPPPPQTTAAPKPAVPAPVPVTRFERPQRPSTQPAAELASEAHAVPEPPRAPEPEPAREVAAEPIRLPTALATRRPAVDERAAHAFSALRTMFSAALESGPLKQVVEAAAGSYRAVMTGLGAGGDAELDEYGQDQALLGQLAPVAEFFYSRYWRVRVAGADRLPKGPAVLVANHSGALPYDGPVLKYALHRERPDLNEARWLVEDQIFYAPFMGTLLNRLGAVRASPENALRLLGEGRPVLVFPEGVQGMSKPIRERYQLKRFGRGGFVKIALRSRAPIVPVAVVGAEEATPLLAKLPGKFLGLPYLPVTPLGPVPLPSRWQVRFGEPIDLSEHAAEAADDLSLVQKLTERTRESIQGMLEAALKDRAGPFA